MSDILKFRSLAELEEEAGTWVWRLDDGDVTPEVRAEFEQWLRQDPRHRRAFEELHGVWQSLDELADARCEGTASAVVNENRRFSATAARKPARRRLLRWVPWAVAASLALMIGSVSWYQHGNETQTLATAVGQQRSATLADGSVVQLNTNTILETRFSRERRVVHLEKGEATFTVAHDEERPFLVYARDTVVRAIGTEFNVRIRETADVEVIVTEGKVEVTQRVEAPAQAVVADRRPVVAGSSELIAGQRFEAAASQVAQISPIAVSNALAWREGVIVFDGEPLLQAISEINRYTDLRLVVADASIHDLRVGGRFRTGDVDGFLQALTKVFPVTTHRTSDHLVYIHARAPAPSTDQ